MDIITGWQIYWLTRCDEIKELLVPQEGIAVLMAFSTLALIASSIAANLLQGAKKGTDLWMFCTGGSIVKKIVKPVFIAALAFILLGSSVSALIPTTKEMAAIVVIPKVPNSQPVQAIGQGIVDLAKDWMIELAPKKVKGSDAPAKPAK